MTTEETLASNTDLLREVQRLDYLCRELKETQDDLADFLEDFYSRVEAHPEFLATANPEPSRILEKQEKSTNASMEVKPTSTEAAETTPTDMEQETRQLYLHLVRKYHPDSAPDGGNPELLKSIIQSYQERRFGSLWKISFEQEWQEIQQLPQNIQQKFVTHYRERLQQANEVMENKIRSLHGSPEYRLQQSVFTARLRGEDLLTQIVGHIHHEGTRAARRMEYYRIRQQLIEEAVWP